MINPEQKENITTLIKDLFAIYSDSDVTRDQIRQLKEDVMALWTKYPPDPDTVTTLETDVKDMIAQHKVDTKKLQADLSAILESMNVPPREKLALKLELLEIASASNIDGGDLGTIQSDLQAIVETAQANHQTERRHA